MEVLQVGSELVQMMELHESAAPVRLLEIGCWDGGTLREWLTRAQPGSTIVAIDLEHRNADAYPEWIKPDTTLVLGEGASQSEEMIALAREHGPYDWVFIDGDHGEHAVQTDCDTCLPLVRPGGLLLFHDIAQGDGQEVTGPRHVFERLRAKGYIVEEYVEDPYPWLWAHGIGVVHIPEPESRAYARHGL